MKKNGRSLWRTLGIVSFSLPLIFAFHLFAQRPSAPKKSSPRVSKVQLSNNNIELAADVVVDDRGERFIVIDPKGLFDAYFEAQSEKDCSSDLRPVGSSGGQYCCHPNGGGCVKCWIIPQ